MPPVTYVMNLDDLPRTEHAHEFVGAEHGGVPFSIIVVHAPPGAGPQVHQHPYAEVFVVESGEATFRLGDDTMVVRGGQVVVGPADVPHGFTNRGSGQLRLTALHAARSRGVPVSVETRNRSGAGWAAANLTRRSW